MDLKGRVAVALFLAGDGAWGVTPQDWNVDGRQVMS
jgi:hypothetical protein